MAEYKEKKLSAVGLIFYLLVIITAVIVFLHFTEIEKIFSLFQRVKPIWFILAFTAQVLTYLFAAKIFSGLLTFYNYKFLIPFKDLIKASVVSLFLNQAVPTASVSGKGYLFYFFQSRKVPPQVTFPVIILEAFTYYLSHVFLLVLSIAVLFIAGAAKFGNVLFTVAVFGIILFLFLDALLLLFGSKKVMLDFSTRLEKHKSLSFLFNKIKLQFPEREVIAEEWESPWKFLKNRYLRLALFWQIMIHLADAATIFVLFLGFNFHPSFLAVLAGATLTKVIAKISISPGSLGFFEGAMVFFYASIGIPFNLAVIVTLLFRALSFWLPMPVGLFLYRRLHSVKIKNGE
jgi:uncharacterized protein (TIRG00374 family)